MSIEFLGIDTETTGLDADKNQIIDICLLLIDDKFEVKDELHLFAFPSADAVIEPKAIEVNGYTQEKWVEKNAVTQEEMFNRIYEFIKGYKRLKLIAHNVGFDQGFLKKLFEKHYKPGDGRIPFGNLVDYHNLDTMCIAMFIDFAKVGQSRRSYRLATLTEAYGVEHDAAHTARSDIYGCVKLLHKMKEAMLGLSDAMPFEMKTASNTYSRIIVKTDSINNVWEFQYGKHKGSRVMDVAIKDHTYIRAVLGFTDLAPEQRTYLEEVYITVTAPKTA